MNHPFHLHVNHFQVISRKVKPKPFQAWRDTVLVPREETVRVRLSLRDDTDKTV